VTPDDDDELKIDRLHGEHRVERVEAPERPADHAAKEELNLRQQGALGYSEVVFEFQGEEGGSREGERVIGVEGEQLLDAEQLSQEAEAPPPPATQAAREPTMQDDMEVTSYYALEAEHGIAATSEAPYTGLALQVRTLLAPIEELLHDRAQGQGVSVRTRSEEQVRADFARGLTALAREHGAVPLVIQPAALLCEGRPVLREPQLSGTGLYRLTAAGAQMLTIVDGIDQQQGEALARVLTQPEGEDDIARWFWDLGLTHARLSILETFEEVEPLPETDIPVLDVADQAVEQMTRLRSKLLSSVPGAALARERATAVRNLTLTRDDLRALDRDLFRLGADLLGAESRREPRPPAISAEHVQDALALDEAAPEVREIEALLETAVLLQEPERMAPLVARLASWPQAQFAKGEVEKGLRFLRGLISWSQRGAQQEKADAVHAVLGRASRGDTLGPLLERYRTLPREQQAHVIELLDLLPPQAAGTLGHALLRSAPPALVDWFRGRLSAEMPLDALSPEQAAGLLEGSVLLKIQSTAAQLAASLCEHDDPAPRAAAAAACSALPSETGRSIAARLARDEDEQVREALIRAVAAHPTPQPLAEELLRAASEARAQDWPFPQKRAAFFTAARALEGAARETLRRVAQRQNPAKRRTISETRVAAVLALTLVRTPAEYKLAAQLDTEDERRVFKEALRALTREYNAAEDGQVDLAARLEKAFLRFDETEEEPASAETEAVRELSPQALKAMRAEDVLSQEGERLQILGAALLRSLAQALLLSRTGHLSSEQFTVSIARAATVARALVEELDGPAALQGFGAHFFVNGQRLRLPFKIFRELPPLRETMERLRIGEILFAEPPSRNDLLEVIYAIVLALKQQREAWRHLERVFAHVRLRELQLIQESWGRGATPAVDVRANAARLFGSLCLWLDDVAHLPDDGDLLPLRAGRLVREMTDAEQEGDALLEGLLGPKKNPGDAALLAAHGSMLACIWARRLGARREQIAQVVRCALFRQAGLLALPQPLLEDLGAEGTIEAAELARVPLYGAARLAAAQSAGQELRLPFLAAYEMLAPLSAEGERGQRRRRHPPLFLSRLLGVVDRFVFLTSAFPGREAAPADRALARMLADPELDQHLVHAFADAMAVVPAGARVRLDDGRRALVTSAPLRPSSAEPILVKPLDEADALRGSPVIALASENGIAGMLEGGEEGDLSALLM
jgi:hypothetical protein